MDDALVDGLVIMGEGQGWQVVMIKASQSTHHSASDIAGSGRSRYSLFELAPPLVVLLGLLNRDQPEQTVVDLLQAHSRGANPGRHSLIQFFEAIDNDRTQIRLSMHR